MNYTSVYKEELSRQSKSKNTIDAYISDVEIFQKWYCETFRKEFSGIITDQDLRDFCQYLLKAEKMECSTVNRKISAIKSFNNLLVASRTGKNINVEYLAFSDKDNRETQVLEKDEFNKLRTDFYKQNNTRDIAIFEILSSTGIRVTELISLELDDIVLAEEDDKPGLSYIIVRESRNGKYREINLNYSAKKAIRGYQEDRPMTTSKRLFIGQRGPITRSAVTRILEKYCREAYIEPIGPHVLRHTFAIRLIKSGVDIMTVQMLLGHSSIQTTSNFYTLYSKENKQRAVEMLE